MAKKFHRNSKIVYYRDKIFIYLKIRDLMEWFNPQVPTAVGGLGQES